MINSLSCLTRIDLMHEVSSPNGSLLLSHGGHMGSLLLDHPYQHGILTTGSHVKSVRMQSAAIDALNTPRTSRPIKSAATLMTFPTEIIITIMSIHEVDHHGERRPSFMKLCRIQNIILPKLDNDPGSK